MICAKLAQYRKRPEQRNLENLSQDQQRFTAKMIVNEVQKIARENNISEEQAYWGYTHGLYGADRKMGE